ncbi:MAG TPA: substrate-binding domain-containing protein, partial [Burkholderiaceae bacterium]|nr:substrate-binding domain-containing protein [Burkholderiaceae bacterium]
QELLPHAVRMLELRTQMMQVATAENAIRGTFRLGVAETLVHTWLHYLIDELHHSYPALVVELHVDTSHVLRSQLHAHQIDLAMLVGTAQDPREQMLHLCDYELAWVASPQLKLHGRKVSMHELAHFPIITYPAISVPYQRVKDAMQAGGVKSPRMFGSGSLSTIIHMTHQAMGPSVLARVLIKEELAQGRLHELDTEQSLETIGFNAVWIDSPDNSITRTVAKLATKIAKRHNKSL